jgi:hypothetical protein
MRKQTNKHAESESEGFSKSENFGLGRPKSSDKSLSMMCVGKYFIS